MKFCFSHCVNAAAIFTNFDYLGRVNINKALYRTKYGYKNGRYMCGQILAYCFYLIFKDIIENNVTFKLPLIGARKAEIFMAPVEKEELTNGIKAGKFTKLDPFASDFKAYKMVMAFDVKNEKYIKPITLTAELKDLMYEKINSGKKYY